MELRTTLLVWKGNSSEEMAARARQKKGRRGRKGRRAAPMLFERRNYVLLLIGIAAIAIGYVIMRIDNQVDGFISLYVAPLIILGGYLEIIYAILWRPREPAADDQS